MLTWMKNRWKGSLRNMKDEGASQGYVFGA